MSTQKGVYFRRKIKILVLGKEICYLNFITNSIVISIRLSYMYFQMFHHVSTEDSKLKLNL